MPQKSELAIAPKDMEDLIQVVRGQRVMLDINLARLYEVTVGALNQAVKRNSARFPEDFAFQLSADETAHLKSQIVISSWGGRRSTPWVFTEQGIAMLSSVLKSEKAAMVNVAIMRAFVKLRRLLATPGELAQQLAKLAETVDFHDDQLKTITEVLRQMMAEPPKPREMGFHTIRTRSAKSE
ncbi:MAG: ORF6N domain-containing protein [Planctomycetia bacterium]|nr:ORF6N domain-containing protein [Planctomycetia bacterium]